MLGDTAALGTGGGSSGDAVAVTAAAAASAEGAHDGADTAVGGGGGSNSGDDERGRGEEGDRCFGGNRWPRQETLALLKIRSDMDVAFRDANVKGPLWEEVSRKMAELGYHRNAKKCKEKFENVYKYHKRTKDGRSGKSDGKAYRFYDQLEAFENNLSIQSPTPSKPSQTALSATPVSIVVTTSSLPFPTTAATPTNTNTNTPIVPLQPLANTTPSNVPPHSTTVPSTTTIPIAMPQSQGILNTSSINLTIPSHPSSNPTYFPPSTTNPTSNPPHTVTPFSFPNIPTDLFSNSSSSSTSSEETTLEGGRRKRKRKWKDFFERLMKEVMDKQEELQKRFLEAIEKRERERVAREEAWRMQEIQRINREREILAQERSMAAAKDAAVMAFLQKIAEQQNLGPALNNINIPQPQQQVPQETTPTQTPTTPIPIPIPTQALQQTAPVTQVPPMAPQQQHQHHQVERQQQQITNMEIIKGDNGESLTPASSSRWPKVEVETLIKLRTNLETKYHESGPKGPLWEEISALMRKMGYNRNAKRCKEKWENINKYFKKVKESNKKRPEDSKTCPYFHQLDALYKEKNKHENTIKPESTMMAPLMVRPEQQWPPQQADVTMEDSGNDRQHNREDKEYEDNDNEDEDKDVAGDDDDEDEDDEGGGNYEIVASKPASVAASAE